MQKLRKIMMIMAVIGTILVTALFCYLPVRNMLRERRIKEISLAEELEYETEDKENQEEEDREEVNGEHVDREGETDGAGMVVASGPAGQEISDIALKVKTNTGKKSTADTGRGQEVEVTLWQSREDICYFFLPGFGENAEISLLRTQQKDELFATDKGCIRIEGKTIKPGDILKDINWEKAYQLEVLDEKGETVYDTSVIFMCSSQLPVLSLTTESGSMEWIDEEKGNQEGGTALLLDAGGEQLFSGKMKSLTGRGNSTWGLAKKPYQMKLAEKSDFFGWGKDDEYVLLANGYDETGLRNEIAMNMAEELGMAYVPQGCLIDLYVNGIFYGNYYLSEKVQMGEGRLDIRDMDETVEKLYRSEELEGLEHLQNRDATRKWTAVQYEDADLSGGYLFERELESRFEQETSGFVTTQGDHYALKNPAYASENQVHYIADLMQEFQDAIEEEDGINPETGKHYSEYIDVDSFLQKYLLEEVTKNYDGGVTSSFFYKPEDAVSTRIFAGPAWDYDVIFGNCNLDEIVGNPKGITELNDHVYGTDVFARLYQQEDFYTQMVALYEEKALPYLNELLETGIDELVAGSRQSMRLNGIRWESLENRYQYYTEYDNSVKFLKYYIENRRDYLNEVWLEDQVYHDVTFVVNGEAWKIIYVRDGETAGIAPTPSRYSSLFMGWVAKDGDIAYDEFKPVYEDATFEATWQELPVEEIILTR